MMMQEEAIKLALPLIKKWEGLRLEAYLDAVGIPTIGYGETQGVKMGDVWTQEQAEIRLTTRVVGFMTGVLKACPQLWMEPANRAAACTVLAYNIGSTGFASSTVCRKTMAQDYAAAADAFLMWNKAGGKVLNGLTNRRKEERLLYLGEL